MLPRENARTLLKALRSTQASLHRLEVVIGDALASLPDPQEYFVIEAIRADALAAHAQVRDWIAMVRRQWPHD